MAFNSHHLMAVIYMRGMKMASRAWPAREPVATVQAQWRRYAIIFATKVFPCML